MLDSFISLTNELRSLYKMRKADTIEEIDENPV